jgi:hypothetical protein
MRRIIWSAAAAALLLAATSVRAQSSTSTGPETGSTAAVVFGDYFRIQKALAADSLPEVAAWAGAIAEQVRRDGSGTFRPELAMVAQSLAAATDLESARQIFKAVSGYMIQTYRAGRGPGGAIHEMHSPAGNVNWLQQGESVQNPYLGKAGVQIGEFVS